MWPSITKLRTNKDAVTLFVPWQGYWHVLTLARGYPGNVESSDHGVKHSIVFAKRDALLTLFSPSSFSGENFIAYRHFKRVSSNSGKKSTYNNNKAKKMIDLKDVSYSILSCVRTVLCKSNSANFVLSCHEFSREISENFVRNYHCQTIFRAKFQGNIAQ